ncbi:MAG: PEP-CTERM sorting domain-containing protein [Syntrophaceae bacterium]|nr:PEP-CTERM sorting domain-containing protein [Syntrophaceae bacterium]
MRKVMVLAVLAALLLCVPAAWAILTPGDADFKPTAWGPCGMTKDMGGTFSFYYWRNVSAPPAPGQHWAFYQNMGPGAWQYAGKYRWEARYPGFPGFYPVAPVTQPHAVPEPTTLLLLGLGLIGVAGIGRFRK